MSTATLKGQSSILKVPGARLYKPHQLIDDFRRWGSRDKEDPQRRCAIEFLSHLPAQFGMLVDRFVVSNDVSGNSIINGRRGARFSVLWRASARHLQMAVNPLAEAHGGTLKRAPLRASAPKFRREA